MSSNSQVAVQGLRTFPPEVRNMIYKAGGVFDGKTPELIKALRTDPVLYQEALYVFYEENAYRLSSDNGWGFGAMDGEVLKGIKNLDIDLNYNILGHIPKFIWGFQRLAAERTPLSSLQRVTIRHVQTPGMDHWEMRHFCEFVVEALRLVMAAIFEDCKELTTLTFFPGGLPDAQRAYFVDVMEKEMWLMARVEKNMGDAGGGLVYCWEGKPLSGPVIQREAFLEINSMMYLGWLAVRVDDDNDWDTDDGADYVDEDGRLIDDGLAGDADCGLGSDDGQSADQGSAEE